MQGVQGQCRHTIRVSIPASDASRKPRQLCNLRGPHKSSIGSNNYLGLAQDERVIEAACQATRKYGSGCTGSRLLNGTLKLHNKLEEALADFLQREAVLLFSTGFLRIRGRSSLTEEGDVILCDRENHASIIDAASLRRRGSFPTARLRSFSSKPPQASVRRSRKARRDGRRLQHVGRHCRPAASARSGEGV